MKKVIKSNEVPSSSSILKGFDRVDYCDSFQIKKDTKESIDEILNGLFSSPKWVDNLMKVRDTMVGIFGLKTGKKDKRLNFYPIGSKAVYFTVINRCDNEIVMAENDKHLNFRASVFIDRKEEYVNIHLTTIVSFNNIWGRLYFFPVKPFHKMIIKSLMKRFL